jgi:tRNA (guanine37-N1)-methyltransferase
MFPGTLGFSLGGKALKEGLWSYNVVNIRDFGITHHKKVDDEPYGGGCGMVMRPDVLGAALEYALKKYGGNKIKQQIFYMSPRGGLLNQDKINKIVTESDAYKNIIIICGRFEGIDQRIITYYNVEEVSIGDFVISGGELAALVLVDACVRLLDGVVSTKESIKQDSFNMEGSMKGLLEYPLYTRPARWNGMDVPEVLSSGNHQAIECWKLSEAQKITKERRPDLWQIYNNNVNQENKQ